MCNPKNKEPRIIVTCPCGTQFETRQKRIDQGRGKFCSQACKYKYKVMPKRGKGTYILVKENSGWFKKGSIPWCAGTRGLMKSWNKGTKGLTGANEGSFKKGEGAGANNSNWKGDTVGYMALHTWLHRRLGKATACVECGKTKGRIEWANKSHEYKRDVSDWISLCKKCHIAYDRDKGWGVATKKFKEIDTKVKRSK